MVARLKARNRPHQALPPFSLFRGARVTASKRFALRHRQKLMASLRYSGWLLLISGLLLACTVGPFYLGWWDTAVPAGIASAIAALLLFAVVVNTPLEAIAYVGLYFDREPDRLSFRSLGFGRALYRESGRLDAMARDAGLTPLSDFESPDPLDTRQVPTWHLPEAALPTVDHLLARLDPALPVHRHLNWLQAALRSASERGAKFYLVVLSWGGGTNARVEALRRGDFSVWDDGSRKAGGDAACRRD